MMSVKEFLINASVLIAIISMSGLLYKQFLLSAPEKVKNGLLIAIAVFSGWASMFFGIHHDGGVIFDLRFVPVIIMVLFMQKKSFILMTGLGIGLARLVFGINEAAISGFWAIIAVTVFGVLLHVLFFEWTFKKRLFWTVIILNSVHVAAIAFLGVIPIHFYLSVIVPFALPTSIVLSFFISWMISDLQHEFVLKQHLVETARKDPLTKLYNRRAFMAYLQQFSTGKRGERPFVLAFIDIDYFKQVNDTYGHIVGDRVLQAVSARLLNNLRDVDIVARYGGEEFVVLLPDCSKENALSAIDRLRERIAQEPISIDNQQIPVTFSAGLAISGEFAAEQLLKRADDALYKAKQAGRNRVICADSKTACSLIID